MDFEFVKHFFCILWDMSFTFVFFIWCITLISLWMLNYPCILGTNITWSWCMILLVYCQIQFSYILLRILAPIFTRVLPVIFFSYGVLILFSYQNNVGLIKRVWVCFFLLFLEEFEKAPPLNIVTLGIGILKINVEWNK